MESGKNYDVEMEDLGKASTLQTKARQVEDSRNSMEQEQDCIHVVRNRKMEVL